ncbi:hypothetical protein Pth03_53440 [Planotetraspora thailandica]|uniref:PBP domain-containing protein n=1 Tax=Planotetraspora thailandica TaxID=487172 RepID=A0A8J3VES5_9ACTN|nr:substrate-binding domain-containing protein [Planotetraspora thailandica]GII56955.1 hypothetical protein Pth03_53440 [Planotetraspora thailandica]
MRKSNAIAAALAATAASTLMLAGTPAMAEPTGPVSAANIVGTGSDTTQDVLNALTADLAPLDGVVSFNATGLPDPITVGSTSFKRPNGSSSGVKALSRSIDSTGTPNISGLLDFARSSRGPAAGTDLGAAGALTFIPMARDAVAYAYNGAGLSNLTRTQLQGIYQADTAAQAKAAAGGVDVTPLLPQAGSGTRSFFIGAIGLTEATLGDYVLAQTTPQENKADGIVTPGKIVPFSTGQWIAQRNGVTESHVNVAYGLGTRLGSPVADVLGDPVDPTLTSAGKLVPNPDYYSDATFGRDVYNVVETARITVGNAKYDSALAAVFSGSSSTIASADSDVIIAKYGFQVVSYAGDTDIPGSGEITTGTGVGDHAKGGALEPGSW